MDSLDTRELLDQARAGDRTAVDRLLESHRTALRRMVDLRMDPALAGRLDASDIVQEVMLEASRRLSGYLDKPVMPFHLWLRHLAKDHIIDAHRRHRQAQRRSLDREQPIVPAAFADRSSIELAAQFLDREATPATAALRQELARRLAQAVASLEDDDRDIILMRHYEQLSNQEVAAMLGLTEAAASMRYLRAVRKLKGVLGETESQA